MSDPTKAVRCSTKQFCAGLSSRISGERRGFNSVQTVNIKNRTIRTIGVRYCRTNKSSEKGILLNYCPFCGTNLQWWESQKQNPCGYGELANERTD